MPTLIKNCKLDWDMEMFSYRFMTGGSKLTALDSLSVLMTSLEHVYEHVAENYTYEETLQESFLCKGNHGYFMEIK